MAGRRDCKFFVLCAARLTLRGNCRKLKIEGKIHKERSLCMRNRTARTVARNGMLFALAIALSYLESMVTPLLGLMPAMKLGLANLVVMYALLFVRRRDAAALVLLKALFALLTRGATAGFLSLCGGGLSLAVLLALSFLPCVGGYIFCVSGALAHNIGQLCGAALLLSDTVALGYAPVLLVAGLVVGSLSYSISRALFKALPAAGESRVHF